MRHSEITQSPGKSRDNISPIGGERIGYKGIFGGINADNTPNYENDPAASIGDYMLTANDPKKICTIRTDEIVQVDYWLYLEGCDDHCSNPVQSRDVTLVLGFEGQKAEE